MDDKVLTPHDVNVVMQNLTIEILKGFITSGPIDPAYTLVRIDWQPQGQPAWKLEDDVAFIQAYTMDNPTDKQRDLKVEDLDDVYVGEIWTSQRVWEIMWILYGPHSFDHARRIRSAMYFQDIHDALAAKNLYMVTDAPQIVRIPEPWQGQWWERTNLRIEFNEGMLETVMRPWVKSAEFKLYTSDGILRADKTVTVEGG